MKSSMTKKSHTGSSMSLARFSRIKFGIDYVALKIKL